MDKYWEFISSGHLVALRSRRECRTVQGRLNVVPLLFVVARNEQHREMHIEPISFEAAATLAREAFESLMALLDSARERDERKGIQQRIAQQEAEAACREFLAA